MQDELDRRVVRALRAGANAFTPTVTTEQVEDRLARTTSSPWQVVAAAMLSVAAAFLFVVLAVGPGRGLPIGNASPSASASPAFSLPPVTELPAGIWVSRSPFRNSTICVAIEIEQPVAARHRAWWWNPGGSGDCGSRSGPIVDAEGATDEFPIVRIEVPTILDGSETLRLRFTGYTEDGFTLDAVPFHEVEEIDPIQWPLTLDQLRGMSEEHVTAYLSQNPDAPEAEYVRFLLSDEAGLTVPLGLTERNLLIYAMEWCAPGRPPPPVAWRPATAKRRTTSTTSSTRRAASPIA